jgi:hypothetical protein
MKILIEKADIPWIFHTDSDCVVLEDVNTIFSQPFHTAYSVQNMDNKYHMVGSIHNSLISIDFCNKFIQLCFDIYDNRSKFHLIDEKIQWHRKTRTNGGICDMTLYYLLYSQKLISNIVDLNEPLTIAGKNCVFDHNISDAYGYKGENTYEKNNGIKIVIKQDGGFYFKTVNGRMTKILSIHFQGVAKKFLESFSAK